MKTDALIEALARGPIATDPRLPERRLAGAMAIGTALAATALLALLGIRDDFASAAVQPMFWMKLAFPIGLALAAFAATARLARPGDRAAAACGAIATLLVLLWALALVALAQAPAGTRAALVAGTTALPCVASVVALSVPLFVAALLALRSLAPTRPRAAGAAAGLLAGAAAAAVYALHCTETALPFLAVWYVLGMTIPAAFGAIVGPRLLRWS